MAFHQRLRPLIILAGGLAVCAMVVRCPTRITAERPAPAASALEVRVPPGCLTNLSGEYVYASHSGYRYRAIDNGRILSMMVDKAPIDGGRGMADGGVHIRLARTPKGFLGQTQATGTLSSGQVCPAEFPTEVVSCDDAGILVRSVGEVFLDEACRLPPGGNPSTMREHRLLRIDLARAHSGTDAGGVPEAR